MRQRGHIVLAGFMATGKSTSGKSLATRLGRSFIDLDEYIEEQSGMSIAAMFAERGEGYFRQRERDCLAEVLAARRNLVLATGGGTLKSAENRALLHEHGVVVCLTADVETILQRTANLGVRPLLNQADEAERRATIERLLAERQPFYATADFAVDTTNLSPLQVTDAIIKLLRRAKTIRN